MPPRWVSAVIVVVWIASAVWLFRLEIWPRFEPDAPPPFTIDLVDEAQTTKMPINWRVKRNGKLAFIAETSVEHWSQENAFTLRAKFVPDSDRDTEDKQFLHILKMNSEYRVTPEGKLLGLHVQIEVTTQMIVPPDLPPSEGKVRLWGEVRDGKFEPKYEANLPIIGRQVSGSLAAVAVSSQGSVVMPLHPINRITGLKLGHEWRVPLFDPLPLMSNDDSKGRVLKARVRPQLEMLQWNGTDIPCLVIDYREDNEFKEDRVTAETWVSETDGRVLRQAAFLSGETWELERK